MYVEKNIFCMVQKNIFSKFSKFFDFWWWFWLWHCKYQYFIKITCKIMNHIQNHYKKSRNFENFEKIFFYTMQNIFFSTYTQYYYLMFKSDGVKNLHKILSGFKSGFSDTFSLILVDFCYESWDSLEISVKVIDL